MGRWPAPMTLGIRGSLYYIAFTPNVWNSQLTSVLSRTGQGRQLALDANIPSFNIPHESATQSSVPNC
jgi:hypothetical protein